MQVNQNRSDVTVTRFLSNNTGQGYSEQAEGGTNFVQMCQQVESCSSQGVNPLLRRQLFLQRQCSDCVQICNQSEI